MSLARDAVKGLALAHVLPIVGLVVSVIVAAVGGVKLYGAHQRAVAFDKGYAFARDSAREASILREIALKDSVAVTAHQAAVDSSRKADSAHSRFATATRYTPRIQPLPNTPRPLVPDSDLVSVLVESTGEQFILPRRAAEYWHTSDSLVSSAQILLQKYANANRAWSEAWQRERDAREASDSLVALLQSRSVVPEPNRAAVTVTRAEKYAIRGAELYGAYRLARFLITHK